MFGISLGEMQMLSIPVSCNLSGTGKQIMEAGQGSCTLVPTAGSTPTWAELPFHGLSTHQNVINIDVYFEACILFLKDLSGAVEVCLLKGHSELMWSSPLSLPVP